MALRRMLLIGLIVSLASVVPRSAFAAEPLVLALFYPWYNYDTWSDPALSDVPAQPYQGADPATIERQVTQAHNAGIDVLVSAWYGPTGDNPTESAFRTLLDTVQAHGMKAAILLETDDPNFFPTRESQRDALAYALQVHAQHPAYLKENGRPAVFVWRPRTVWEGGSRINRDGPAVVDAWNEMRSEVDPNGSAFWAVEPDPRAFL